MSSLFLLEIHIEPHEASDNVFDRIVQAIETGVKEGNGSCLQLLQVTGEDTILAVLEKEVTAVRDKVREAAGKLVRFKCTPVRPYENFARLLGITDEKLLAPKRDLNGDGVIYWSHTKVQYKGFRSLDELFRLWKMEAEAVLGGRAEGKLKLDLYKAVFQREVHVFCTVPSGDALDDLLPTFPIWKEMGDQLWVTVKGVELIRKM